MPEHFNPSNGIKYPDYELFQAFKPGNRKKNMTYGSEQQLEWYKSKGIHAPNGLAALLMKMQNTQNSVRMAIIYDNTGAHPRQVVYKSVNGIIEINLLTENPKP